ncbi:aureocin A53 family class IId bacteriocin [Clostridium sp. Marseille-Q2269]|nr:aureocin A53 family class IId bacteriocin [Clostridium sp. Marseille-Q2269]
MGAVLKAVAKYGSKAVKYVWAHKSTIMKWIDRGMSAAWIADQIRQILGM